MITISELASKHNYLSDLPFVFGSNIWEYDIRQANINTLRALNRISEEDYYKLSNSPKLEREIVIGNRIKRDPSIQTDIYRGIAEAKYKLLDRYSITPDRVLRIANDAVYIISPKNISNSNAIDIDIGTGKVTFVLKGFYNYYMNFKKDSILFFFGPGDELGYDIDVIGINDNKLYLHQPFIEFFCRLINSYEYGGKSAALFTFNEFFDNYINRRLPIEYYREFRSSSGFRINSTFASFVLNDISAENINKIDIGYNLNILRTIYSYLIAA